MKHFSFSILVVLASLTLHAQTDVTAPVAAAGTTTNSSAAPPLARPPTKIDSDSWDFDMTARRAVYRGHVHVDDPQMKLTCVLLTTDLPETGGRPSRIVAETNVVIDFLDNKDQTNHATSDKAVYVYSVQGGVTNETVTFTGNARVENAQSTLTGEPIFWDRVNNLLHAENQKMVLRQNLTSVMASTNPPPATTYVPPGTNAVINQNTNSPTGSDF